MQMQIIMLLNAFHLVNFLHQTYLYQFMLWLLVMWGNSCDIIKWFFFSWWHHQAAGRCMPSGSQVNLVPLWIVAILIWNSIENINFFPGEYKSWPSKVKLWSGRPGTLSSPSCSPSTTPSLRLLPSRMMLETNFVSGCLECCMRSGSLLVSNHFLDPLSGRPFR